MSKATRSKKSESYRWLFAGLAVLTLLAYAPALTAPYVLDDAVTIDAASKFEDFTGMPTAGRPLVKATLFANSRLNASLGLEQASAAASYRVFNLLLHLVAGAL